MAIYHSQRSSYLHKTQAKYHKASKILIYVFLIVGGAISAVLLTVFQKTGLLVLIIVIIFIFSLGGYRVIKEGYRDTKRYLRKKRTYGLGHIGEEIVENELRKLPDTYHVFCDLMVHGKRGNLDFVVVGPKAIFLIDVKNSSGNIYSSGGGVYSGRFGMNYIPVMQKEVTKLRQYLDGPLSHYNLVPILLFSNPWAYVKIKQPVQVINILSLRQLNSFLTKYSGSSHDINRVIEVLTPLTFRSE